MSGYENVVGGKLKLKGKALDVKAGSLKKKKKKHVKKQVDSSDLVIHNELSTGHFSTRWLSSCLRRMTEIRKHNHFGFISHITQRNILIAGLISLFLGSGQSVEEPTDDPNEEVINDEGKTSEEGKAASYIDHLTPAERRYIEQRERIDVHRMAKEADKSHRDRIQDFNQYLANMSEHYDIPKVGPG